MAGDTSNYLSFNVEDLLEFQKEARELTGLDGSIPNRLVLLDSTLEKVPMVFRQPLDDAALELAAGPKLTSIPVESYPTFLECMQRLKVAKPGERILFVDEGWSFYGEMGRLVELCTVE